jgi:hypothetical protein
MTSCNRRLPYSCIECAVFATARQRYAKRNTRRQLAGLRSFSESAPCQRATITKAQAILDNCRQVERVAIDPNEMLSRRSGSEPVFWYSKTHLLRSSDACSIRLRRKRARLQRYRARLSINPDTGKNAPCPEWANRHAVPHHGPYSHGRPENRKSRAKPHWQQTCGSARMCPGKSTQVRAKRQARQSAIEQP